MSNNHQKRLQKILHHLTPSIDTQSFSVNKCSSTVDDEQEDKKNATKTSVAVGTTIYSDIKNANTANSINEAVNAGNTALKEAAKHAQSHGYNAEIHTETTFNIDAIKKGSNLRAERNSDYHGKADIFIKNGSKIKAKAQIKCTNNPTYAKNAATNKKYDGMTKVVNKEMVHKHKNLKSNVEVDGVQSKPFKHSEMKNKKDFNQHKTSKNQLKKEKWVGDASNAALLGGAVSGVMSVATDIWEGDKSVDEIVKDGIIETVKGGAAAALTSVTSATIGATGGNIVLGACDVAKYCYDNRDDLDGEKVAKKTVSVAANTAGSVGGAHFGASIGVAGGPAGVVVGGIAGGIIGGLTANWFSSTIISKL